MQNYIYSIHNYKEEMKKDPIITRIKLLKVMLSWETNQKNISKKNKIHRNTLSSLKRLFKVKQNPWDKEYILNSEKHTYEELRNRFNYLDYESRKPHSHPSEISPLMEYKIRILFVLSNRWYKKMRTFLKRYCPLEYDNHKVTLRKIRWVYKRNNMRVKKVRTRNREYRSPYDFQNTLAFSRLYADTKHICDQHALPKEIYEKFKNTWSIPKYELNVIEQNCRIRFISYLYKLDTYLVLEFLKFVCLYIRWNNLLPPDEEIVIWVDNGLEFCLWSVRKETSWNKQLEILNARIYSYNWPKDPRKNLIERSHLSDDEEFYIPRWYFINTRNEFLKEARDYQYYWNFERDHSWINDLTPSEKALQKWIYNAWVIKDFPTLILQNHFDTFLELKNAQYVLTPDLFATILYETQLLKVLKSIG